MEWIRWINETIFGLNLEQEIDLKGKTLRYEKGKVEMRLIKQKIKDLIMMPTKIELHIDEKG